MQPNKSHCKCKKCGQPYLLYVSQHFLAPNQWVQWFTIATLENKTVRCGIAVAHC